MLPPISSRQNGQRKDCAQSFGGGSDATSGRRCRNRHLPCSPALVADRDHFERLAHEQLALPQAQILSLLNRLGEIVGKPHPRSGEKALMIFRRSARTLAFRFTTGKPADPSRSSRLTAAFVDASSAIQAPFQILGAGHQQRRRLKVADPSADISTIVHEVKLAASDGPIAPAYTGRFDRNGWADSFFGIFRFSRNPFSMNSRTRSQSSGRQLKMRALVSRTGCRRSWQN